LSEFAFRTVDAMGGEILGGEEPCLVDHVYRQEVSLSHSAPVLPDAYICAGKYVCVSPVWSYQVARFPLPYTDTSAIP
jgi:hypothetical protein